MSEPVAQSQCLIVAESDVLVRTVLSDYLRACGYKVIEAADCDEVVTILEKGEIPIDAILLETGLGGSHNAFELRVWLRRTYPQVLTLMAGTIDTAVKAAGELCEEGPHLVRPYHPQTVLDQLRRLLASSNR
jgi:DNA-binding response OmpR family regulator